MIKNFKPRLYQETILGTTVIKNTLVVLPTGLGKTNIFLMLAAQRLKQYPKSKIMLLGPTRPLIDQYFETFKDYFETNGDEMAVITGMVSPEKRKEIYKTAKIVFSTPQSIENDVIANRIDLKDFSLIGFDEAHRAVGNYAYVFIAKQYEKNGEFPRIIAMTASPGSDMEKIDEVTKNLFIEDVEVRTENSPDVKPYVQEVDIKWVEVDLPKEFLDAKKYLEASMKTKLKELKHHDLINSYQTQSISKKELLVLQASLQSKIASGEKTIEILCGLSLLAECMKLSHALELLESQGIFPLNDYLSRIQKEAYASKTKAVINLAKDINFKSAVVLVNNLFVDEVEHPKLDKLVEVATKKVVDSKKAIVFTQFRDSGKRIVKALIKNDVTAELFVGQMKKNGSGLSQKKQKEMLDEFRDGKFKVLVSTSVGEEGLDIPKVDYVMFYEPIPSAIRSIQRRGRTGRLEKGSVIVFLAKNTRDVAYKWSAHHKEKRMYVNLEKLKKGFEKNGDVKEKPLTNYVKDSEEVFVYADHRERGNGVIKELVDIGVKMKLEKLDVGDFLLSSRTAVEFKTVSDFVDSIVDGRLLQQIKELSKYEKPLLIIEGKENVYNQRNVHPNAIRGMIATITVNYGIPLLYSDNAKETAALMAVIAKREQIDVGMKDFSLHSTKPKNDSEMQEYIVSSLPGVGPTLAKPLLEKFKTVKKVMNAHQESLEKVDLIGPKKAKKIRDILDREYEN